MAQTHDFRPRLLPAANHADGTRQILHDEIYLVLRTALENGELSPGQSFAIRDLSEHFGTSLIPVRDALKRLVAEGSLQLQRNRTVCVPLMTRPRFQELLQVRLSLEPALARRATELIDHATVVELTAIDDAMHAHAAKGEAQGYLSANYAFHFKLYAAAQSTVALPIVKNLWGQCGPVLNGIFTLDGTAAAKQHHGQVLRSLRRRDSLAAAEAIAEDLRAAADLILARDDFVLDANIVGMPRARKNATMRGQTPTLGGRLASG